MGCTCCVGKLLATWRFQTSIRVVPWPMRRWTRWIPSWRKWPLWSRGTVWLTGHRLRWVGDAERLKISPFKSFILNPVHDCVHKYVIFHAQNWLIRLFNMPLGVPFFKGVWNWVMHGRQRQVDTLFLSRQQPVPSDGKFLVGASASLVSGQFSR